MSPQRVWALVMGVAAVSGGVGFMAGVASSKNKFQKQYEESSASMRRAFEAVRIDAETPVATEEELEESLSAPLFLIRREANGVNLEGDVIVVNEEAKPSTNPYHVAVEASSPQIYASYAELDEEDYYDEDGRLKEQLTMVYVDGTPHFFHNGEEIDDAFERVGGSIVDDMREAVNTGTTVIWVRNNQTEVDYEVIFEQP